MAKMKGVQTIVGPVMLFGQEQGRANFLTGGSQWVWTFDRGASPGTDGWSVHVHKWIPVYYMKFDEMWRGMNKQGWLFGCIVV